MIKVSIAENLEEVEKRISAAAKRSGRKREAYPSPRKGTGF